MMAAMAKVLGKAERESDSEELMVPERGAGNHRQHGLGAQESRVCRVGAGHRQVGMGKRANWGKLARQSPQATALRGSGISLGWKLLFCTKGGTLVANTLWGLSVQQRTNCVFKT